MRSCDSSRGWASLSARDSVRTAVPEGAVSKAQGQLCGIVGVRVRVRVRVGLG